MLIEAVENSKAIEMFEPEPSLDDVELGRVIVDRDGPTVTMSIHLRDYPAHPPVKWRAREHNAVTMDLQAMAVEQVALHGWGVENRVSIKIEQLANGRYSIRAVGETAQLTITCGFLRVTGVTPYHRAA